MPTVLGQSWPDDKLEWYDDTYCTYTTHYTLGQKMKEDGTQSGKTIRTQL